MCCVEWKKIKTIQVAKQWTRWKLFCILCWKMYAIYPIYKELTRECQLHSCYCILIKVGRLNTVPQWWWILIKNRPQGSAFRGYEIRWFILIYFIDRKKDIRFSKKLFALVWSGQMRSGNITVKLHWRLKLEVIDMQWILLVLQYQSAEPIRKPCFRAIWLPCLVVLFVWFWSCYF